MDYTKSDYDDLVEQMNIHIDRYYLGRPSVSDAVYDQLMLKLKEMEKVFKPSPISPTQQILGNASMTLVKQEHPVRMLSLDNVFNQAEFSKWVSGLPKNTTFNVQYKYDGIAISVVYVDGKLDKAITRGTGTVGENIYGNVIRIPSIPKSIPESLGKVVVVRGELLLPKDALKYLNDSGENYSNCRNAIAGIARSLSPDADKLRMVMFIPYDIDTLNSDNLHPSYTNNLTYKADMCGFHVPYSEMVVGISESLQHNLMNKRDSLPFDVDGIVYKVDDYQLRNKLGETSTTPKWAIAFKFPPMAGYTELLDVNWDIGRTGVYTPVALLSPIELAGVTVAKATLHNNNFLNDLNVRIGDDLLIERAGDVIPKVVGVKRKGLGIPISTPSICSYCESPLNKDVTCINEYCSGVLGKWVLYLASRELLNINGIGDSFVERLPSTMTTPADLWSLTLNDYETITGSKVIGKSIYERVRSITELPLDVVLATANVPTLGKRLGKTISDYVSTVSTDNPVHGTLSRYSTELAHLPKIGELKAKSIVEGLHRDITKKYLNDLSKYVNITYTTKMELDKIVCLTGKFDVSRDELVKQLNDKGYKVVSNPSSKCEFALVGDKPSSTKVNKIKELNIPIKQEI